MERSVKDATGTLSSTKGIDIAAILDEYLSAVFLEVRMMANYFRRGYAIFETTSESFASFDYIIRRRLPDGADDLIEPWRRGFILGLKKACAKSNLYIASVFHNVLATYYLNRSSSASSYQLKRLQDRVVYIDTNVLYALRVEASNYHELVETLLKNLSSLGVSIRVFPFTIEEYEASLLHVEQAFDGDKPRPEVIRWNPWLFQEFMLRPGRYMNKIGVCRQVHRIKKDNTGCLPEDYDAVDRELQQYSLVLERDFVILSDEEINELWSQYSHKMPSNSWSLDEYWEFLYKASAVPLSKRRHDVHCLVNVGNKARNRAPDELGPQTLFLTLDRNRLLRLRKILRYIGGAEQLFEFFLPYFFLKDIPVSEAETFPNELLAAHLGALLVKRPPKIAEVAEAYVRDSGVFGGEKPGIRVSEIEAVATAMNDSRFSSIANAVRTLPIEQRDLACARFGETLEEIKREEIRSFYERASDELELKQLRSQLSDAADRIMAHDAQTAKLRRTVSYWKGQARTKS